MYPKYTTIITRNDLQTFVYLFFEGEPGNLFDAFRFLGDEMEDGGGGATMTMSTTEAV